MRALALLLAWLVAMPAAAAALRVYAAASLAEAANDAADAHAARGHERPVVVLAGSPALARQVAAGAPADVVWLADRDWVDWLAARRLLRAGSIVTVTSNRLVLVVPRGAGRAGLPVLTAGRWTTASPDSVPLGRYTKAALTNLGVWRRAAPRLVATEDARAALALVERRVVRAGIVYATDARASRRVRVEQVLPAQSHPAIVYPAAVTPRAGQEAKLFVRGLLAPAGQALLARRGFTPTAGGANRGR